MSNVEALEVRVAAMTSVMRTEADYVWPWLRDLFREAGHDPDALALARRVPDHAANLDSGIVVTRDGRVFEFTVEFTFDRGRKDQGTEGPGKRVQVRPGRPPRIQDAVVTSWHEITGSWKNHPFKDDVEAASRWLQQRPSV